MAWRLATVLFAIACYPLLRLAGGLMKTVSRGLNGGVSVSTPRPVMIPVVPTVRVWN